MAISFTKLNQPLEYNDIINTGKHKSMPIWWVICESPDYLLWMHSSKMVKLSTSVINMCESARHFKLLQEMQRPPQGEDVDVPF